ncbi:MAG: OmpH family outer membrane protein [Bacteroidales bacterium]|jgi:outer membrane protein|nr:OmpH family outer membrane protein [Bacteroidales bacterium]
MKKITWIVALLLLLPAAMFAQNKAKFGHVNYGDMIKLMPGVDTAEKVLQTYQAELQAIGEGMYKEFQEKTDAYQRMQNVSAAVMKIKEDELRSMYERLQQYSQSMQIDLQNKQLELLKPFQDKLLGAIKEVAKAENFTYIFDTSTLTYYETGEDIASKVKLKLGIK